MEYLERGVIRFMCEKGGKYRVGKTVEECWDSYFFYNKEKPDKEEFIKKVNEYMLICMMDDVRTKRNELLNESDWTQMNDVKLEDDAAWKIYRQALRDLPSVVDLEKIVYPLKPGESIINLSIIQPDEDQNNQEVRQAAAAETFIK